MQGNRRRRSIPLIRFMHVALGIDFQHYRESAHVCVCSERERVRTVGRGQTEGGEKAFPGICAFTLKIKPSKNPVGKKKLKLAVVLGLY